MYKPLLIVAFLLLNFLGFSQTKKLEISVFVDESRIASFEEIQKEKFEQSNAEVLNFGSTNDAIWLKIKAGEIPKNSLLEIGFPIIDTLDVYKKRYGTFTKKRYGSHLPLVLRPYSSNSKMFLFDINSNETIYFRISSTFQIELPIKLTNIQKASKDERKSNFFFGIFFGVLVALLLYNLLLSINLRNLTYLHYVGYIFFSILFYLTYSGFGFKFLYPYMPIVNYYNNITANLVLMFILLFSMQYFDLKQNSPKNIIVFRIIIGVLLLNSFLEITLGIYYIVLFSKIIQLLALLICSYLMSVGFYLFISKKMKNTMIYSIAWGTYLISIIISLLATIEILPLNFITKYSVNFGALAEAILFSVALALNLEHFRKEKQIAKEKEIHQRMIREKIAIEGADRHLIKKVKEKTVFLEDQIDTFDAINRNLKMQFKKAKTKKDFTINNREYIKLISNLVAPINLNQLSLDEYFTLSTNQSENNFESFFWIAETKKRKIIALIDSNQENSIHLIINDILKEIIYKRDITRPNKILTALDRMLKEKSDKLLESTLEASISIICLNKVKNKIEMASALKSVLILENNQIKTIKGDDFGIGKGKESSLEGKDFTYYNYFPKEDTRFYLATKKAEMQSVFCEDFKKILVEIYQKPMIEQREAIKEKAISNSALRDLLILGLKF